MSMDRLFSRSVPHLPRYQSTSPSRSPRLESRRFASLHSVSKISYIEGEPSRGIHSYHHSPSPKRAYKVHLIPSKPSNHLVRSSKSLSQSDLGSSHVYTSLEDLSAKLLQGRDDRVKVTSCEDIYHKRPFFPDVTASESGVSMEGWEDGSQFGDDSSQHSFGSSSAIFDDVLPDIELDRAGSESGDGRKSKRVDRRSSGDMSGTESDRSSPVSYTESKRRELMIREYEKSRFAGLRVHIPSDDKGGLTQGHNSETNTGRSKPLAQSTPHVSPRGKYENKLSVKASWSVDDLDNDIDTDHRLVKSPASRSLFDMDMSDADLQSLSRCGESSFNTSFSEDTFSDASNSTIMSPVFKRTDLEKQKTKNRSKSCENIRQDAHGRPSSDNFDQDDCGYGTDHYHSQIDLLDTKGRPAAPLSAESVAKVSAWNESWAFMSIGVAEERQKDAYSDGRDAPNVLKPVKIPLIMPGKKGQEKLKRASSQMSPPLDRTSPGFSESSAFYAWDSTTIGCSSIDTDHIDHSMIESESLETRGRLESGDSGTRYMEGNVSKTIMADHISGPVCEYGMTKDHKENITDGQLVDDRSSLNDSGLVLLNDSNSDESALMGQKRGDMCEGPDRVDQSILLNTENTFVNSSTLHQAFVGDVSGSNFGHAHYGVENVPSATAARELTVAACSPCDAARERSSCHGLKKELEIHAATGEIPGRLDDASACIGVVADDVIYETGDQSPRGGETFNSWDSPMKTRHVLTMRQPIDGAIDQSKTGSGGDKEGPGSESSLASSVSMTENTHTALISSSRFNHGDVPTLACDSVGSNFRSLESKNSLATGFDLPTHKSANDYSSFSQTSPADVGADNCFNHSKNSTTEIYSCEDLNSNTDKDSNVSIDMRVVGENDSLQGNGKNDGEQFDTDVGQQGGIGGSVRHFPMPVVEEKSIMSEGSGAHVELRVSQVESCSSTVDRELDFCEERTACEPYFNYQNLVDSNSVVEVVEDSGREVTTVEYTREHFMITDVTPSCELIDECPKPGETHMACPITRGGGGQEATHRGPTNTGDGLCDSTIQPGGNCVLGAIPDSVGGETSFTSGVSLGNTCVGETDLFSTSDQLTVSDNVILLEMTNVSSGSVLDNIHAQLFRISSYEDESEGLKETFRDSAKATSAIPCDDHSEERSFPVDGMDEQGTFYSYSISVREPEPDEACEPVERELYDNDDGIFVDPRTYTYRRHFPASLVKSGHIKSSSLWTLQEETESLIDAQSPRTSPKRLFGLATSSEEEISSGNSSRPLTPSSNLSNSEERLHDLVVRSSSPETGHSDRGECSNIIESHSSLSISLEALTESYGTQAKETSLCGPFPPVVTANNCKSPLDILSDSLEQFQSDTVDERLFLSDSGLGTSSSIQHSWTDELASETSSRLQDFDNELSFISSSVSPSPSDLSDGSVYTSTGTAQVRSSKSNVFDYDTILSPSDEAAKEVKSTQKDLLITVPVSGTNVCMDKQFEKLLEEFSVITAPQADLDLYKEFTNDDSEKKQNHVCIVVEEDSMDAFRFKRFLKKSHTKRKKGKKLLRFLTSLGCVSEGARSPESSPKKSWSEGGESVYSTDNMASNKSQPIQTTSFQKHTVLKRDIHQPPRENSPTSSSHSLDSVRSRADSAYSSLSESHMGDVLSTVVSAGVQHRIPSKSSGGSVSSVFHEGRLSLADSAYESATPGPTSASRTFSELETTSHPTDALGEGDVMSAFSEVFEQLHVCASEIDTALLRHLRHGHTPAETEAK